MLMLHLPAAIAVQTRLSKVEKAMPQRAIFISAAACLQSGIEIARLKVMTCGHSKAMAAVSAISAMLRVGLLSFPVATELSLNVVR